MTSVPLWQVLMVGLLTGGVTLVGGTLVFRFSSALDVLLGFSSGTIIGVALFDLIPEGLGIAGTSHGYTNITTAVAVGFASYLAVDRTSAIVVKGLTPQRQLAPAALTLHSFFDGLGIGLAFHVSSAAGVVVTIGVLAHDLVDGANTVAVTLSNGARSSIARAWLIADALAPLTGILLASMIAIPALSLAVMLGVFGGFFLYIGASQLLPRSQARRPGLLTTAGTLLGLAFIYAVIRLSILQG